MSNVSLAVNSQSERAGAGEKPVFMPVSDCSCKQTAVLIIRDTGGCIERGNSRPDILGRSRCYRSYDLVDDNS